MLEPNQLHGMSADDLSKLPWGKVLYREMTTDRYADFKLPIWKSCLLFLFGNGWHRKEFRLILPSDPNYDPTPREREVIF